MKFSYRKNKSLVIEVNQWPSLGVVTGWKGMRRSFRGWQHLYLGLWVVSGAYAYVKIQ